ncbi:angiopoietin-1 receptor-like [Saccostrea cucullata]|uniref:angiopoietin-1 receptor-like n=1 Tax=Saccostrea cuccullata TaxID=36930 RepID=UPI002ECFBF5A
MVLTIKYVLIFIVIDVYQSVQSKRECLGRRGCCDGYQFDKDLQKCTRCPDGFVGAMCASPCPYPGYGFKCNLDCNCTKEFCNVTRGCPWNCTNILNCSSIAKVEKTPQPLETSHIFLSNLRCYYYYYYSTFI